MAYPKQDIDFIRDHGNAWLFTGERVLITGATGFIGSWLAQVLDYQCNLTLDRDFVDGEYDTIFHFAPTPIEPVIACAKRNKALVVYTSSGAVYGGSPKQVTEDAITKPKTEYGREKLRSEMLLQQSGLEHYILRIFTTAGPGLRDSFALTNFVNDVKNNRPIMVHGNGKAIRSYLYIADLLVWMLKIVDYGKPGIYNVGSERAICIGELAKRVAAYVHGHEILYRNSFFVEAAPYYLPDCTKAKSMGLYEHFDLDYMIGAMLK